MPLPGKPLEPRIEEYVEGARKVLADDLPAGHKLWKSWALDLADNVLTLARKLKGTQEQLQTAERQRDLLQREADMYKADRDEYDALLGRKMEERDAALDREAGTSDALQELKEQYEALREERDTETRLHIQYAAEAAEQKNRADRAEAAVWELSRKKNESEARTLRAERAVELCIVHADSLGYTDSARWFRELQEVVRGERSWEDAGVYEAEYPASGPTEAELLAAIEEQNQESRPS